MARSFLRRRAFSTAAAARSVRFGSDWAASGAEGAERREEEEEERREEEEEEAAERGEEEEEEAGTGTS